MKYLLDTSVFLWALAVPNKLNRQAREILSNEREGLFLSVASSWEISVKFGIGKLSLPEPPTKYIPTWMLKWGIRALDISHLHALAVGDPSLRTGSENGPTDRELMRVFYTEGSSRPGSV